MLFMISGYLYALYDHRSYGMQMKNRFVAVIPYLLWSAGGLLLTFLLQQVPYTADVVRQAGIDQYGDNRPYAEIGWNGVLARWIVRPISYQLWFIASLFIYNAFTRSFAGGGKNTISVAAGSVFLSFFLPL